jgi:antitoxin ParD1/3/4
MRLQCSPARIRSVEAMNISLTPELEKYVSGKVQGGMYHSASEVIREGLRLLKEKDELHQKKLEDLRREIQIGIDQADRGQVKPLTDELVQDIKDRGRKRLAAQKGRRSS